jgi:hypothetical protein
VTSKPNHTKSVYAWTQANEKLPTRQGFYAARIAGTSEPFVAEWREYDKALGRRWYQHLAEAPAAPKKPVLLPEGRVVAWAKALQEEVDAALAKELTLEENVLRARDFYYRMNDPATRTGKDARPVPDRRRLSVGDAVHLGALKDVRVQGLFEEGYTVVVSYHNIAPNYGNPLDLGTAFMAVHWTDVVRKGPGDASPQTIVPPKLDNAYRNSTLDSLVWRMLRGVNSSPDYRRDYAWGPEDKQRLLDSLFAGHDIGRFIFVNNAWPQPDDILDGKQRLSTLADFFTSRLAHRGRYWDELSVRDRDSLENRSVQFADVDSKGFTRAELLEMFLQVNVAGVPQSEEHLRHVQDLLAAARAEESALPHAG